MVHNYQQIKLHTAIPHEQRSQMHSAVLGQIELVKHNSERYKEMLPKANEELAAKIEEFRTLQEQLRAFESQRCEQIHSSIGQFIVFEKYAEMNNKYDVKNFSNLIDSFNLEREVEVIADELQKRTKARRVNVRQTLFDPVIEQDGDKAAYAFAPYKHQRYDLDSLDSQSPLLVVPPATLCEYANQQEVLNYILDKAFVQQPLYNDIISSAQSLFKDSKHRDAFIKLVEIDYQSYQLDWRQPEQVAVRNLSVSLPATIFDNVADLFYLVIEAIRQDTVADEKTKTSQVMRVLLFSRMFSRSTGGPASQRMLTSISSSQLWKEKSLWQFIAKIRLAYSKKQVQRSSSPLKDDDSKVSFDPLPILEDMTQDMQLCNLSKTVIADMLNDFTELKDLASPESIQVLIKMLTGDPDNKETFEFSEVVAQRSYSTEPFEGY